MRPAVQVHRQMSHLPGMDKANHSILTVLHDIQHKQPTIRIRVANPIVWDEQGSRVEEGIDLRTALILAL